MLKTLSMAISAALVAILTSPEMTAAQPTAGGQVRLVGVIPLALVFNSVNPILAQGAALADLPMLAGFDEDITLAIPDGSDVEVDPERSLLTLFTS